MTQAVVGREKLAALLARVYGKSDQVRAILLTGSVGTGLADEHSDLELSVFWAEAPSELDRVRPAETLGITVVELFPLEANEWSEVLDLGGLRIDVSNYLMDTVEATLKSVLGRADVDVAKQLLIAQICAGWVLLDKDARLVHYKRQTRAYPESLARAMVRRHLVPHWAWEQRHALAERGDLICFQEMALWTLQNLLAALCGLNGIYVSHPSFKWFPELAAHLPQCPAQLDQRARDILRSPFGSALTELEGLIAETCDLIEDRLPGAGAKEAKELFGKARPRWGGAELEALLHGLQGSEP